MNWKDEKQREALKKSKKKIRGWKCYVDTRKGNTCCRWNMSETWKKNKRRNTVWHGENNRRMKEKSWKSIMKMLFRYKERKKTIGEICLKIKVKKNNENEYNMRWWKIKIKLNKKPNRKNSRK